MKVPALLCCTEYWIMTFKSSCSTLAGIKWGVWMGQASAERPSVINYFIWIDLYDLHLIVLHILRILQPFTSRSHYPYHLSQLSLCSKTLNLCESSSWAAASSHDFVTEHGDGIFLNIQLQDLCYFQRLPGSVSAAVHPYMCLYPHPISPSHKDPMERLWQWALGFQHLSPCPT